MNTILNRLIKKRNNTSSQFRFRHRVKRRKSSRYLTANKIEWNGEIYNSVDELFDDNYVGDIAYELFAKVWGDNDDEFLELVQQAGFKVYDCGEFADIIRGEQGDSYLSANEAADIALDENFCFNKDNPTLKELADAVENSDHTFVINTRNGKVYQEDDTYEIVIINAVEADSNFERCLKKKVEEYVANGLI